MKLLEIGANHALWHLKFLEKFQFIRSVKIDNKKIFFKFNIDSSHDKIHFYLRNKKVKKIINLMENNDSNLNPTEISNQLKIHYNTARKYLKILSELNLVKISREIKKKLYSLDQKNYYETLEELKALE